MILWKWDIVSEKKGNDNPAMVKAICGAKLNETKRTEVGQVGTGEDDYYSLTKANGRLGATGWSDPSEKLSRYFVTISRKRGGARTTTPPR